MKLDKNGKASKKDKLLSKRKRKDSDNIKDFFNDKKPFEEVP